jgi:hypothetical protein
LFLTDWKNSNEKEKLLKELSTVEAKTKEVETALGESSNRTVATRVSFFIIILLRSWLVYGSKREMDIRSKLKQLLLGKFSLSELP